MRSVIICGIATAILFLLMGSCTSNQEAPSSTASDFIEVVVHPSQPKAYRPAYPVFDTLHFISQSQAKEWQIRPWDQQKESVSELTHGDLQMRWEGYLPLRKQEEIIDYSQGATSQIRHLDTMVIEEEVGNYLYGRWFQLAPLEVEYRNMRVFLRVMDEWGEQYDPALVREQFGGDFERWSAQREEGNAWSEEVYLEDSAGTFFRMPPFWIREKPYYDIFLERRKELLGARDTFVDRSGEAQNIAMMQLNNKPLTHIYWEGILRIELELADGSTSNRYVRIFFSHGC